MSHRETAAFDRDIIIAVNGRPGAERGKRDNFRFPARSSPGVYTCTSVKRARFLRGRTISSVLPGKSSPFTARITDYRLLLRLSSPILSAIRPMEIPAGKKEESTAKNRPSYYRYYCREQSESGGTSVKTAAFPAREEPGRRHFARAAGNGS